MLSTIKYTIRRLPKAYFNISWRLDIAVSVYNYSTVYEILNTLVLQLARRNMNSITKPKFAILLELKERKDDGDDVFESLHLQADFANMKMIQQELQKAIDEYNGVHCQRMRKYIN